jgi:hypothetical protein
MFVTFGLFDSKLPFLNMIIVYIFMALYLSYLSTSSCPGLVEHWTSSIKYMSQCMKLVGFNWQERQYILITRHNDRNVRVGSSNKVLRK